MNERAILFSNQFKRDLKKHFLALASAEWAEVLYCLMRVRLCRKNIVITP